MGTMVNRAVVGGAVMLVMAGSADAAKKVKIEPSLHEGQTMTYQMAMHLGVSQTKGTAPTSDSTILSGATVTITIKDIDKHGSADAEMVVDQVELTGMMDGREAGYSWPMVNGLPDDAPAIAHLGETLCNSTIKLYI